MKKVMLLTMVMLVMLTAVSWANGIYDNDVSWTETPNDLSGVIYAYAPEFTTLNPNGRLETVVKVTQVNGNYSIEKTYVTPSFDRCIVVTYGKFKSDGSTIKIVPDADKDWHGLIPGSAYDQCVLAAYQYAKTKH
ncbi:MAG: hypothetical protein H6Q75_490 [Firmicutes bacterium]|nr:hypothetical protein [Bacillota bacterium]